MIFEISYILYVCTSGWLILLHTLRVQNWRSLMSSVHTCMDALGWGGWVYTCIKCDHMTVLYIYIGSTAAHAGWAWPAWSPLRGPASWRGTRTGGTDGGQQWVCPPGLQQEGGQSRTCGHTTCTSASQHHSKGTIYLFLHHFTSFPSPPLPSPHS